MTLSSILAAGKPIHERELHRMMHQVCLGFAGLHKLGLAHRDVKPDNIMITHPGGNAKILDFGLVQDSQGLLKLFEEEDIVDGHDFADDLDHGILAGTPEYMAPEQISDPRAERDARETDTTADVYSLGVIFYQLLTGRKLFPFVPSTSDPRGTHEEVMKYLDERLKFGDDDLKRPEEISGELWSVVRKALRKDPKMRQGSALQLAGDLEIYMKTGHGISDEDLSPTIRGITGIPRELLFPEERGGGPDVSQLSTQKDMSRSKTNAALELAERRKIERERERVQGAPTEIVRQPGFVPVKSVDEMASELVKGPRAVLGVVVAVLVALVVAVILATSL